MAKLEQCADDAIFIQIVNTFGRRHQLRKLAEELTEAGAALQSWLNAEKEKDNIGKIRRKEDEAYKEIADVLFMLEQKGLLLNQDKLKRHLSEINMSMIERLERVREDRRLYGRI